MQLYVVFSYKLVKLYFGKKIILKKKMQVWCNKGTCAYTMSLQKRDDAELIRYDSKSVNGEMVLVIPSVSYSELFYT